MYKNVLRNRNFNLYFVSRVLSKAGTSISGIAFLLLVYNFTHSGVQTTGVALAETIPYALFGLIGGVSADRLPKKLILISLDAAQGTMLIATTFLYATHQLTYPVILAVTFLVETAGCFYNPTSRAVLPIIIDAGDKVPANSLVDISNRGTQLIGPAAAYFFLHWINYEAFFLADAISYLMSTLILLLMHIPKASAQDLSDLDSRSVIAKVYGPIAAFAKFAWRTPDLRNLFIATTLVVFFNTCVWQIGLLLQAESLFHNGQQMYSVYLICFSVFSIVVCLLLPLRFKALRLSHYMVGAAVWGAGILGAGVSHHAIWIAIFSVLVGIGMPITGLSRVFLLQDRVPEAMRGRAFSFSAVLLYVSNMISLALFGMFSRFISVPNLFDVSGIGIVLVAFVYVLLMKSAPLRRRQSI
jgi:hypothetical protein